MRAYTTARDRFHASLQARRLMLLLQDYEEQAVRGTFEQADAVFRKLEEFMVREREDWADVDARAEERARR